MHKTLKNHFPIIRDRIELKMEIYEREELRTVLRAGFLNTGKNFSISAQECAESNFFMILF